MATYKEVPIRSGVPSLDAERVNTLQEAIDLAYGTAGHIHEGPANRATAYPQWYAVCDCDA